MTALLEQTTSLFRDALARSLEHAMQILPEAALAVGIVLVGLIIAVLASSLTVRILDFFAVDKLVGKTPLDRILKQAGIQRSITRILSALVFWLVVFATLIIASDVLHLEQVSRALSMITRYIPQVIAALVILIAGMLLATFLRTVIVQAAARAELGYEKALGKIAYTIILLFVILAAIRQLGMDLSVITTNVMIMIAAIALIIGAGAIIGARSILENALAAHHLRHRIKVGDEVIIGVYGGTVLSLTSTSVVLQAAQGRVTIPAAFFIREPYTIQ